jgi:hypothetical protein
MGRQRPAHISSTVVPNSLAMATATASLAFPCLIHSRNCLPLIRTPCLISRSDKSSASQVEPSARRWCLMQS